MLSSHAMTVFLTGLGMLGLLGSLPGCSTPPTSSDGATASIGTSAQAELKALDLAERIDAALATATPVVNLEAGRFRLSPPADVGVIEVDCRGKALEIAGTGTTTELVVDGPKHAALSFSNCPGLVLRDLAFDYGRLPFSQGTIREVDPVARTLDVQVDDGYAGLDDPMFQSAELTAGLRVSAVTVPVAMFEYGPFPIHPNGAAVVDLGQRVYRIGLNESRWPADPAAFDKDDFRAGQRFVLAATISQSVVRFSHCAAPKVQRVRVSSAPGVAFGGTIEDGGAVFEEVIVAPKPDRLLSTNNGGINLHNVRGPVTIDGCRFSGFGDDAVAISTGALTVTAVKDQVPDATGSLVTKVVASGTGVRKNDTLQIYDPAGGQLRARHVAVVDVVVDAAKKESTITLAAGVPGVALGDWLLDVDAGGRGSVVKRSRFYGHSDRDIVVHSVDMRIEDNVFYNADNYKSILLEMNPDWPIGPAPAGLQILNNRFIGGNRFPHVGPSAVIESRVVVDASPLELGRETVFEDITIQGNRFLNLMQPAVSLGNVDRVLIGGPDASAANHVAVFEGAREVVRAPLRFDVGRGVEVQGNVLVDGNTAPAYASPGAIEIGAGIAPGSKGFTANDVTWRSAARRPMLIDER